MRKRTINKVLDVLIWLAVAFIVRNYSAEMRGGLFFGGELAFPTLAAWWHFMSGKSLVLEFIHDMTRGE